MSEQDNIAVNDALEYVRDEFQSFVNAQAVTEEGRYWLETAISQLDSIIKSRMEV